MLPWRVLLPASRRLARPNRLQPTGDNALVNGPSSRFVSAPGPRTAISAIVALACVATVPGSARAAVAWSASVQEVAFGNNSPAFIAIRWLWFLSIAGSIGAVVFRAFVLGRLVDFSPEARREASIRAAHIGLVSTSFALAAAGLRLMAQSVALLGDVGPDTLILVTGTSWGSAWLVHTVAAVVALVAFGVATRSVRLGWWLAALASLGLGAGPALTGHAAAARLQPVPMIADTAHVLAAGGWIGGLLVVLAAGIPAALAGGSGGTRRTAALINAFSPVAIVCAGTLVATGVFAGWLHVGSFAALLSSGYGRLLSLKLATFLAVAGFGAWNFLRLKPRLTSASGVHALRRSAVSEIALGAVVLLVTAILVATSPPVDSVDVAAGDGSACTSTGAQHAGLTLDPCSVSTPPPSDESSD